MNIARSFATYLEGQSYGTFGEDIFIGGAPLSAPDSCFWVLSSGGPILVDAFTGEKIKAYTLLVYYRSRQTEDLYEMLQGLEIEINGTPCISLDGFDVLDVTATLFPTDEDIDDEDRTIGLIEVTCTVHSTI